MPRGENQVAPIRDERRVGCWRAVGTTLRQGAGGIETCQKLKTGRQAGKRGRAKTAEARGIHSGCHERSRRRGHGQPGKHLCDSVGPRGDGTPRVDPKGSDRGLEQNKTRTINAVNRIHAKKSPFNKRVEVTGMEA